MHMKTLKDPLKTSVRGLKDHATIKVTVKKIQAKILEYGVCSDREQRLLDQHTDYCQSQRQRAGSLA
jgi:hypothetical protein